MIEYFEEAMDDKIHLSDVIDHVTAVYFCDDVSDFYYCDEEEENYLRESLDNNTVPENVIISNQDVADILKKIKSCERIFIEPRHKNGAFLNKYDLSIEDCKSILSQLTIDDFIKTTKSFNKNHAGNNLIVFEPSTIIINDGVFEGLIIYIKLDVDMSTGTDVVAVSFHETNRKDK